MVVQAYPASRLGWSSIAMAIEEDRGQARAGVLRAGQGSGEPRVFGGRLLMDKREDTVDTVEEGEVCMPQISNYGYA